MFRVRGGCRDIMRKGEGQGREGIEGIRKGGKRGWKGEWEREG